MPGTRLHVMGASGAGTTTLGRALAQHLAAPHHDTDDFYWMPTPEPFSQPRKVADRLRLMHELFLDRPDWVLSGALTGWGDPVIPRLSAVVFVYAPGKLRLKRLRLREVLRHGDEALRPGGRRYEATEDFLAYAASYDDPGFTGRSLLAHRSWLDHLSCPVIEIDGTIPTLEQVSQVTGVLDADAPRA